MTQTGARPARTARKLGPARLRAAAAVILVGVASGLVGTALTLLLHAVQWPAYGYRSETFLTGVEHADRWRRLAVPTIGGVVLGVLWWHHRRRIGERDLTVRGALRSGSRLPLGATLADAVLQVVAVGIGASVGREGAPRRSGAALAAWVTDRLGVGPESARTLMACGGGAGLAAMYDVPLAGAAFTLEVLLVSRRLRHVVPALLTSVIAVVVTWPVLGTAPTYAVARQHFAVTVLLLAVPLGALAGVLGHWFNMLMIGARRHAPRGAVLVPVMGAGFAVLGAVAMVRPELLGNGKGVAQTAFDATSGLGLMALLALLKPLLTALCFRVGAVGGLITPSFATGAALGAAAGIAVHRAGSDAAATGLALVGAAAFLAATQRAALTSLLLTVELTRSGVADVPALAVGVLASVAATRALTRDTGPVTRTTVVAAAIVRGGHLLAARRTTPPESAGRWELPGGKVEAGETPEAALVREIGEELGCLVEVDEWLPDESPIGETLTLRAALCHVTAGEPRPREHDQIRWLAGDELDTVDWLEPDLPFVAQLTELLLVHGPTQRAVLFDDEHASSVEERLHADGWWAAVRPERLHGDDDDEDPQWIVETDAPAALVELLVEEYDGWLDVAEEPDATLAPEPLPNSPKRIKRPR